MTSLLIPCPKCGKILQLRDRRMLGRKRRCPKCEQSVVLKESDKVDLETVDASTHSCASEPTVDTSNKCLPANTPAQTAPDIAKVACTRSSEVEYAGVNLLTAPASGIEQLNELRRKNTKRRNMSIGAGAITALAVAGVILGVQPFLSSRQSNSRTNQPEKLDEKQSSEMKSLEASTQRFNSTSPTKGAPIQLLYVPGGARFIFNTRPAELWKANSLGQEVCHCLGPLGNWAKNKLQEICRHHPAQIDEALICLIPGEKDAAPEVSAVVHLIEETQMDQLVQELQAIRSDAYDHPVYLSEQYAYLIKDSRTFAIGPRHRVQEMVDAVVRPNYTSSGIEELINHTDRDRHLTIIFEPIDARKFQEVLVEREVWPFWGKFLDRFDDTQIETVAWSMHLEKKRFFSEILLRNTTNTQPAQLQRDMKQTINELPAELLKAIKTKMQPNEFGRRKIIGRFPAMMKVFSLATIGENGNRYARLVTSLDTDRAAPNLAIGAMLTWEESRRTDSGSNRPAPGKSAKQLPQRIINRLKIKIDIDFNRTPLQEAFAYNGK